FARAAYNAAVQPAHPDPMITTFSISARKVVGDHPISKFAPNPLPPSASLATSPSPLFPPFILISCCLMLLRVTCASFRSFRTSRKHGNAWTRTIICPLFLTLAFSIWPSAFEKTGSFLRHFVSSISHNSFKSTSLRQNRRSSRRTKERVRQFPWPDKQKVGIG